MRYWLKKSGFTLVELLVVVGIFSLIIGASLTLFSTGRLSVDIGEAQIQAQEHVRQAIDRISRELRLSRPSRVHISDAVLWTTNNNSGSVINFQIPVGSYDAQLDLNPDNSLKWGSAANKDHCLAYSINASNQLSRSTYTAADGSGLTTKAIAQNIPSITFSRTNSASEFITITINGQVQSASGDTITRTLQSSIKLRN